MRRRAFLTSAAAGLAGLAGCLGDDGTDAASDPQTDSPTGSPGDPTSARTDSSGNGEAPTQTAPPGNDGARTPTTSPGNDGTGTPTDRPGSGETPTDRAGGGETPTDPSGDGGTSTPTGEPTPPERIESAWPLPAADAGHTNGTTATGPTERVAVLWHASAGGRVPPPVVADGTLYLGRRDGTVLALDARNGSERWRRSVGEAAGIPRAVGDRLYVPTPGGLVALAASDGSESWRIDAPDRVDVAGRDGGFARAALSVTDGGIYAVADEESPRVVARALADGSERWRAGIGDPWELPIFAGAGAVFVSSGTRDSRFWRLDAESGDLLGKKPRPGHDFPAEQCYANGTVFAVDPFFGTVRATSVSESGHSWSQGVKPRVSEPGAGLLSHGSGRVYYTTNHDEGPNVYALGETDGGVAWTRDLDAAVVGRVVVAGEAVLVPTNAGLLALDPSDGTDLWLRPGNATGEHVVVADDLVFTTKGDVVRAFRPP